MQRVSREEFSSRFPIPIPARKVFGIQAESIRLEEDAEVSAIVEGDILVPNGVIAVIQGIIDGSVIVEAAGVAYIHAIVKGTVDVRGSACIDGLTGNLAIAEDAIVHLHVIESSTSPAA